MKDLMDLGKKVAIAGGKEAMKYFRIFCLIYSLLLLYSWKKSLQFTNVRTDQTITSKNDRIWGLQGLNVFEIIIEATVRVRRMATRVGQDASKYCRKTF